MNVTFVCQKCGQLSRTELDDGCTRVPCTQCGEVTAVSAGALQGGQLAKCLVCPSTELYVRKNFPQRLGVTIVVAGIVLSCIPWYFHNWFGTFAILFATALIDVILYLVMGNVLQCYRCQAHYSGLEGLDDHHPFDLEIHERHRQLVARLKEAEHSS